MNATIPRAINEAVTIILAASVAFLAAGSAAFAGWKNAEWGMTPHEMALARVPQFYKLPENSKLRAPNGRDQIAELGFFDVIFETIPVEGTYLFTNGRLTGVSINGRGGGNAERIKERLYSELGRPVSASVGATADLECKTFSAVWKANGNLTTFGSQVCNRGIGDLYIFGVSATDEKIAEISHLPALKFYVEPSDERGRSEIDEINLSGHVRGQVCEDTPLAVGVLSSMGVAPDCKAYDADVQLMRRQGHEIEIQEADGRHLKADLRAVFITCRKDTTPAASFFREGKKPDFAACR